MLCKCVCGGLWVAVACSQCRALFVAALHQQRLAGSTERDVCSISCRPNGGRHLQLHGSPHALDVPAGQPKVSSCTPSRPHPGLTTPGSQTPRMLAATTRMPCCAPACTRSCTAAALTLGSCPPGLYLLSYTPSNALGVSGAPAVLSVYVEQRSSSQLQYTFVSLTPSNAAATQLLCSQLLSNSSLVQSLVVGSQLRAFGIVGGTAYLPYAQPPVTQRVVAATVLAAVPQQDTRNASQWLVSMTVNITLVRVGGASRPWQLGAVLLRCGTPAGMPLLPGLAASWLVLRGVLLLPGCPLPHGVLWHAIMIVAVCAAGSRSRLPRSSPTLHHAR